MSAPHLSAERTALAWRRTAVAAMVVGTLFLHQALERGWRAAAAAPSGAAITMAALAGACYLRNRGLRRGHYAHGGRIVAATAAAVFVGAVAAAAAGSLEPGAGTGERASKVWGGDRGAAMSPAGAPSGVKDAG
ncbi:DUF202 domain-containing protein, partial [Nocardia abscessus]|uniref:DUF202 domain-containing protein n=1 Tax=Nocardia abscessus TaxID=120957 RepID=UPI0024576CCC